MAGCIFGKVACGGHTWQEACMAGGACVEGGMDGGQSMHSRGHVWQGGVHGRDAFLCLNYNHYSFQHAALWFKLIISTHYILFQIVLRDYKSSCKGGGS